jgi:hypothetical protein
MHPTDQSIDKKIHTMFVSVDMEAVAVADFAGTDPRPRPRPPRLPVEADIFLRFILDSTLDAPRGSILGDSSPSSITCARSDGIGLGELCAMAEQFLAAYLRRGREGQRRGVACSVLTYGEGRGPAASDLPCGACVGGTAAGEAPVLRLARWEKKGKRRAVL